MPVSMFCGEMFGLFTVLICFLAGMGAGLGTGFAGMSAAAVISPTLITFLDVPAYQAVGIALASDVLASAVSAYTYGKNKNLDIKNGLVMMAAVLAFTMLGSWLASLLPSGTMGGFSMVMTLLLGIKFIVKPVMTTKEAMRAVSPKKRVIQSVVCGTVIGLICGFVGAGGGMMMLLILTSVLGYELKTAVGTSVFMQGKKVLLVDADPQGDLTTCLGWQEADELPITISDKLLSVIMNKNENPYDGILKHEEGVDLVPSNLELSSMEIRLVTSMCRERAMKNYLSEVKDKYDYILIDCMPSLGMITLNALIKQGHCLCRMW